MAWYKEWFGEDYLELYAHRDEGEARRHLDFVERLFGDRPPRAVLDLACGAGRHSLAAAMLGAEVTAVDRDADKLVQKLQLIGDDSGALFLLDGELAKRKLGEEDGGLGA